MILSEETCNKGRQSEIDCLKAFCIICMILLHSYEECAEDPGGFYNVLVSIEALTGAGAFMICMGIGMRYSRKQSPAAFFSRAISLLTVGQVLNLCRDSIPSLVLYWVTGDQYFISNSLLVISADILTFAGIAFLLLGVLKKFHVTDRVIVVLGLVMNVATFALSKVFLTTGSYLFDQLLGFFIVTKAESYFSLGSYFVFVAFGYALGGVYLRIKDKDTLSSRVLRISGPIVLIYYFLRFTRPIPLLPEFFSTERYVMTPATDAVALCLMTLVILALFHKLLTQSKKEVPAVVSYLSKHINEFYCISYVLLSPLGYVLYAVRGEMINGNVLPLLYGFVVIGACYFIIEFNQRVVHFGISNLTETKRWVVYTAIWLISISVFAYAYPQISEYSTFWNDYWPMGE